MNAVVLSIAGTVVALAALGAALWQGHLLKRQIAHAEHVSNAQFYQNITVQWIEFDKFLIDRSHLWPYFHTDEPAPPGEPEDRADLACMAAAMGNLAEICVNSKTVLGPYTGDWERYFRFVYLHGPYFRQFWAKYHSMWSAEVGAVFLTPIADLEVPAPEMDTLRDGLQVSA